MHFLGSFVLYWSFLAFVKPDNLEPLYLIDPTSQEAHFEAEYFSLDQCTRRGMDQTRHESFSLLFQLTGKCENGFVICYPGALDPSGSNSAFGMRAEIQFQVPNHPESKLGAQCMAHQKKMCSQMNAKFNCSEQRFWHGINVSSSNSDGTISVELSIAAKTYNIGRFNEQEIFSIQLGNPHHLITTAVHTKVGRIFFEHDDSLRDAYFERKPKKDVMLINYAGFWMLGLDFLPMNNQDKVQMHVYRDCGCEMHAWFAHPSDDSPTTFSGHPEVSADCPASIDEAVAEHFSLRKPLKRNRVIRLRQRLNKHPHKMVMHFGNEQKKHMLEMVVKEPPDGLIEIKSTQANESNEEFMDNEKNKLTRDRQFKSVDDGEGEEAKADSMDRYIEVQLVARKYFYEVTVDRKMFNFFPKDAEWWKGQTEEDITQVEIAGDVYPKSVGEPLVDDKPESEKQRVHRYVTRFDRTLKEGDIVVIKGKINQPRRNETHLILFFGLLHNSPGYNELVSVIPWFLTQKHGKLIMGRFNPEDKYVADPVTDIKPFEAGEPFEMQIKLLPRSKRPFFKFFLSSVTLAITVSTPNGTSQMDYSMNERDFRDINYLTVRGDVELFADPLLNETIIDDFVISNKQSFEVWPLLTVGDSILVHGKLLDNATFLKIELFHDVNEKNPYVGDLVMQLMFNFTNGKIQLASWIHKVEDAPDGENHSFPTRLFPGEDFKIEIRVAFDMFQIYIYGAYAAFFNHVLPPWSVDYMNINGDYKTISRFIVDRTKGIFRAEENRTKAVPFVMEVPLQQLIQRRDSIKITGTVTKENGTITVLLLNQAIETYDNVPENVIEFMNTNNLTMMGKVVSRADFFTDSEGNGRVNLSFLARNNTYEGQQSFSFQPALSLDDSFDLKILFTEYFEYEMILNDSPQKFVHTENRMPAWAIEYIRIEGDLELESYPFIDSFADTSLKSFRGLFG